MLSFPQLCLRIVTFFFYLFYLFQLGYVRGIKIKFIFKLMWIDFEGVEELVYANSSTLRH